MQPKIAVNITANDKTEAGRKSAEKGFNAFARKTSAQAKESGFDKIAKQLGGLTKFRNLDFGFGSMGRSLSTIRNVANDVGSGLGSATRSAVGFGVAGEGAMAAVAEGAGVAAAAIGGTVAAVAGLAAGTYLLGEKWAKTGAEIDRTSKTVGMTAKDLQNARAAGERFGVTADATTASVDGLGQAMYDVRSGANNIGVGVLAKYGKQLKYTKDGAVDTYQALLDVSDIIAQQKDPYAQRTVANIFGVSAMLPLLRQGSGAIKAAGADYQGAGAALSDAEVAKSSEVFGKTVTLKQHLAAGEKNLGVAAEGATGAAADKMLSVTKDLASGRPLTALTESAQSLAHSGLEAGRHLIEGATTAGRKIGEAIESFTHRLERQESGGHQLDRHGHTLTSRAGAMGVRQMLIGTAQLAARRANIPWDAGKFAKDPDYNRQLSDAHIAYLAKKYGGDQVLMAAAYNAGEGVLDGPYRGRDHKMHSGWLSRLGDPRKGEISDEDFAKHIPFEETRKYAENVAHKAHVEIVLKGAPSGTVARVTPGPGVDANLSIARGMDGP